MPDEFNPHRVVAEALEHGVRNRDWFVWLTVNGTRMPGAADLNALAEQAETWLSRLDPENEEQPELAYEGPALSVRLRALPKKPHARGANPLVGNPYPAYAQWVAS